MTFEVFTVVLFTGNFVSAVYKHNIHAAFGWFAAAALAVGNLS